MDLFDVLSQDERILVLSDPTDRIVYTWNQSLTLQCWKQSGSFCSHGASFQNEPGWEEIDCQTLSEVPLDFRAARQAALKWKNS